MTRRPRVVHLTTAHNAQDPRIVHKELGTLRDAGFEAHLVAPHARSEVQSGIRITALPEVAGRYRRAVLQPQAYRAARTLRAALYHFHDPELIPVGYALRRATQARVVYDMHENYRHKGPVEGRLLRAMERWCFRWADHVVVANPAQASIPAASGAPATVVANYFKPPAEVPAAAKPPLADFRLVYAGVMAETRGLLHLVDLAAHLRRAAPRWRLDLVGVCYRTDDRRRAERRIRATGADGALCRTGWDRYVPWPELIARCYGAHVGLLLWNPTPHHLETVPTKLYQYLHAGLPVLCSDFPQYRALIEKHGCGAVVPPGDTAAAFRILKRWTEDAARYRELAANARAAAAHYRWDAMGLRLVRLYKKLLG